MFTKFRWKVLGGGHIGLVFELTEVGMVNSGCRRHVGVQQV